PINIQAQTHIDGVKLFRSFLTATRKHSINRKLSYNKKKTHGVIGVSGNGEIDNGPFLQRYQVYTSIRSDAFCERYR
ncbi:hypothetical protein ACT7DN_30155, partial [Bacillus paranthracis]